MNILVIGAGYVGTTTGLVFAELGHKVTGLDIDSRKIDSLNKGELYFYEPGLEDLLINHLEKRNITFSTNVEKGIHENDVIFICVGTPSNEDGSANLSYIEQVARDIGHYMNGYKVIVDKSTVPIGTSEKVAQWIIKNRLENHPFDVVSNPEFLREGNALHDALYPDRVVIGSSSERATSILKELYKSMTCPVIVITPRSAEMIKYAANSFLAMKISFINELARLCDKLNINIQNISHGIGLDKRIGPNFLQAGVGYGGSCFPKDVDALLDTGFKYDTNLSILEKVVKVNKTQYLYFLERARQTLGSLKQKRIALFGLSFKPQTDDLRESPALYIINELLAENAVIKVHDPIAKLPLDIQMQGVVQYTSPEETAKQVDAILIGTDWPQYKELDWKEIKTNMRTPYVFDGRNMLDANKLKEFGLIYQGIGYK